MENDVIYRQAAIDAADSETVSTNPDHFKSREKFIKFMDDDDIASFGKWKWANGFNTALVAVTIQLEKLPSAQPDRSCIEQIKWERNLAIQQLNELGYSFGEAIRHDKDTVSRKGAINAVCTVLYPDADKMNDAKKVLKEMPSAQPEYYDYSDIEPLWKSFAEENDINLTDTAKQLKDAMWCGYRKGKADAQSEPCEDADKLKRCKFEYINACKTVTYPTPDTNKSDIHDAYAVMKALHPIFGDEDF